ncbi:MAG: hypothetical protein HY556_08460 [Euryarchaeota archaeon]|nr:hypothetical protein [Euryarchaeota archaeon]
MAEEAALPKKKGFLPKFGGSKAGASPVASKPKKSLLPAFGKKRATADTPPAETEEVEFMELDAERPEVQGDATREAGPSPSDAPEPLGETPAVTGESLIDEADETADREITIELPEGEETQGQDPIEEPAPPRRAMQFPKIHFGGAKGKKVREEAIVASESDAPPVERKAKQPRRLPSLKPKLGFGKKGPASSSDEPRTMVIPGEPRREDAETPGTSSGAVPANKKMELPSMKLPFKLGKKKEAAPTPEPAAPSPGPITQPPDASTDDQTEAPKDQAGSMTVVEETKTLDTPEVAAESTAAATVEPTMSVLETSIESVDEPPPRPRRTYDYEAIHTRIDEILKVREYHGLPPGVPKDAPAPANDRQQAKSPVPSGPPPSFSKRNATAGKGRSSSEPVDDRVDRVLREKGKLPSKRQGH